MFLRINKKTKVHSWNENKTKKKVEKRLFILYGKTQEKLSLKTNKSSMCIIYSARSVQSSLFATFPFKEGL